MMRGRSPLKIKPQTESGRESSLSRNGTGHSGHVRNISRSTNEGDFTNTNLQPESPAARKDQLQITSKKIHADALTRSSSTVHEAIRNRDLNNIKKPVEHHYMKTTKCFNAKSQKPVDLDSPKVKKKPDPDPYGVRRKSENIRGLQQHKPAELVSPYLKARTRPSSVDIQSTPVLKRSPSVNSSRVSRQNTQGIAKQAVKKKISKGETEVGSFTSDHLSYTENDEGAVEEIIKDESSYSHYNKQEKILEIDGVEIKTDMISQTSLKDEMELLIETGDLNLSFNPEIICGIGSSDKLEVITKHIPEIKTKETIMEGSPKNADRNLEVITENKILERFEVSEENIAEIEKNVAESFPPEKITSDKDESSEKHVVIDTKYEEIDDLCVISSSNDETDDLGEISIEDELAKIIGTENTHYTEQEQNETDDLGEISIEDELSKIIVTDNTHCTKEEQNEIADHREISIEDELSKIIGTETHYTEQDQTVLSIDIVSIIDEIANELEEMEKHPTVANGDDMHPTWRLKKWKVDYVIQRIVQKLESTDKNKVSKLIQAFECVIPLMMRRMSVPHQASSQ